MHTNITNYAAIMAGAHKTEYRLEIEGTAYENSSLISCKTTAALFDSFGIGNAVARTITATIVPQGNLPVMAGVNVFMRVTNGTLTSSWVPKGQFFLDTRTTDSDGLLTVTGYDAMLKADSIYMESGTWAAKTALAVLEEIADSIGVSIEASTESYLQANPITLASIPAIGTDGTTKREMLKHIAVLYGGNFAMTDSGELKLHRLGVSSGSTDVGVLMESLSVSPAFEKIRKVKLFYGDISYEAEQCNFSCPMSSIGTMASGLPYALIYALTPLTSQTAPAVGDYIKITDRESKYYRVTVVFPGISVTLEEAEAPGRLLSAECFYASAENAQKVLNRVFGFSYQPYAAVGAEVEIAVELGDAVTLNGTQSYLYSQDINFDVDASSDVKGKSDEEINHEYPFQDAESRKIKAEVNKLKATVETELKVLPGQILGRVSKGYAAKYSDSTAVHYSIGDFVIYEDKYYICTAATIGGAWDETKWNETSAIDMSESLIEQSAEEIKAEVYGVYSEKWTAATKYYPDDILELTTTHKFYQCIREHTSNSSNMPPNSTYWTEVDAPTGQSFINLGLRGITIQNSGTTPTGSNQASIKLTKDSIDIAAGTITMSNVTVDSIAANKITGGYLRADVIYTGDISADSITSGELNANNVSLKGLFSVTDKSGNDAGYIGGFTFGTNNGMMYMKNHVGNASISVANLNVGYDVGLVGISADELQLKCPIVLDDSSYGSSLPRSGSQGQLFFLI